MRLLSCSCTSPVRVLEDENYPKFMPRGPPRGRARSQIQTQPRALCSPGRPAGLKNSNKKANSGKAKWSCSHNVTSGYEFQCGLWPSETQLMLFSHLQRHRNHSWLMLRFGNWDSIWQLCSPGGTEKMVQVGLVEAQVALLRPPAPRTNTVTEPSVCHKHTLCRGVQPATRRPHVAQDGYACKIINLFKTLWDFFAFISVCVFNVWPKKTLLLPVWPRGTKRLDTPV